MTKAQYQEYENAVATFLKDSHISCYSTDMKPSFSWYPCQCCRTRLGGDRVILRGISDTEPKMDLAFSICTDCEYYLEYGQLDDMTMMDMRRES